MIATSYQFAVRFDPDRLKADLARIEPREWLTHYNASDFEGTWTGVALRAVVGSANPLYADPSPGAAFAGTAVLDRCPYFQEVLASFRCPLRSVRLLSLGAGSRIREHRDPNLGIEDGEARLHIPVVTNPDVEFVLDGRRLVMNEGETWYLNLSRPHRVKNLGATDRVHLVIDCVVNDWLRALVPTVGDDSTMDAVDEPAESAGGLDQFRALVLRDLALQERLREALDRDSFAALVVRAGRERGYRFDAGDVDEALRASRRAWSERAIQ